jgi:spermidine synthase
VDWNPKFIQLNRTIPEYQWRTILEFVDANIVAMEMACPSLQLQDSTSGDSITIAGSHYDSLHTEMTEIDYEKHTCDFSTFLHAWKREFQTFEMVESFYRKLVVKGDDTYDNVCLAVDNLVEICSSFRPYLEYNIHTAAQYVKELKRVAIIGGGNSMLLHEALKYPNLEMAVVIELDQDLMRTSFKHFGTSPHLDNPKVEWWFGDPVSSLTLFPKEYWGSFDLVFDDLATEKPEDLPHLLSHLLAPNGIYAKSDLRMESLSDNFEYTARWYFRSPEICHQAVILGSKSVDFFHSPLYAHSIPTLLQQNDPDSRLELLHDYIHEIGLKHDSMSMTGVTLQQDAPLGLLHVVNLEENATLSADEDVKSLLRSSMESVGFSVLDVDAIDAAFPCGFANEGYVVFRKNNAGSYIGFEILLWDRVEKIGPLKAKFLQAFGVRFSSSYNIVVGGIIGGMEKATNEMLDTGLDCLKEDQDNTSVLVPLDPKNTCMVAIAETRSLTLSDDISAVVVCGNDEVPCLSLEAMRNHSNVGSVIEIFECVGINEDLERTYECENQMFHMVQNIIATTQRGINMVVMDGACSIRTYQIWDSILARKDVQRDWMEDFFLLVTWSFDLESQRWKSIFLDRFRQFIHVDPVSKVEISLTDASQSFSLGIVSTDNPGVAYEIQDLERRLQAKLLDSQSTTQIQVQSIHGGVFSFDPDPNLPVFQQSDYSSNSKPNCEHGYMFFGQQVVLQLLQKKSVEEPGIILSMSTILHILMDALGQLGFALAPTDLNQINIKKGGIATVFLKEGNIIAHWDGDQRITVNCFSVEEGVFDKLESAFSLVAKGRLETTAYDHQPRGHNAINYPSDFEGGVEEEEDEEEEDEGEEDEEEVAEEVEEEEKEENETLQLQGNLQQIHPDPR